MKSKKKKKKITIKDIIRLIVLLVAFSVLLYPTFSSYLNEKNGSKVVSYYDEESVKLSNFCTAPSVSLRAKTAAAYSSSVVPENDVPRADLIASL